VSRLQRFRGAQSGAADLGLDGRSHGVDDEVPFMLNESSRPNGRDWRSDDDHRVSLDESADVSREPRYSSYAGLMMPIGCDPIELRLSIIWRHRSGVAVPAFSSMRTYGCPGTAIDRGATMSQLSWLSRKSLIAPSVLLLFSRPQDDDRPRGDDACCCCRGGGDSPGNPSSRMVPVNVNVPVKLFGLPPQPAG